MRAIFLMALAVWASYTPAVPLHGKWIIQENGDVLSDPQPSGLVWHRDKLLFIADRSADPERQQRLFALNPTDGVAKDITGKFLLSERVKRSCFAEMLQAEADYEGLALDRNDSNTLYLITEDSSSYSLSKACRRIYGNTFSSDYPALLVRLQLGESNAEITGVKALSYLAEHQVGDYPNDGLEGITIDAANQMYVAKEKDSRGQARIFTLDLTAIDWQSQEMLMLEDAGLNMPPLRKGRHPLNGLEFYQPSDEHPGYLLGAARNHNELWIIDLAKQKPAKVIQLSFYAPTLSATCDAYELMDNASIEGFAVHGHVLYTVNDPWKINYMKNLGCSSNRHRYWQMAALLFALPLQVEWFN